MSKNNIIIEVEVCPAYMGNTEATYFKISSGSELKNTIGVYKSKDRCDISLYREGKVIQITELGEKENLIFSSILETLGIPETYDPNNE